MNLSRFTKRWIGLVGGFVASIFIAACSTAVHTPTPLPTSVTWTYEDQKESHRQKQERSIRASSFNATQVANLKQNTVVAAETTATAEAERNMVRVNCSDQPSIEVYGRNRLDPAFVAAPQPTVSPIRMTDEFAAI